MKNKVLTEIEKLLKKNNLGIKLDIGCGDAKQKGFVGMDVRPLPGVDIVQDIEMFPWPLPDESVSMAVASHVLEHINPGRSDPKITVLIDLLLKKKLLKKAEIEKVIGNHDPGSIFMSFMDEVWRIMKTGGVFMIALPYGGSFGYWQDPTHCNGVNEATWAYFDPLHKSGLWNLYKPKPWRIENGAFQVNGFMEVALYKRKVDEKGNIYE